MDVFYLGTIILWAAPWVPKGWALCDGSKMSINGNEALFSLIGSTYGGDDRTYFNLPDFKGYISVGAGTNPSGSFKMGEKFGFYRSFFKLNEGTMPEHDHEMSGTCTIPASSFPMMLEVSGNEGEHSSPVENDCLAATTAIGGRPVKLYRGTLGTEVSLSGIGGTINPSQLNISGKTESTGGSQSIEIENVQRSCVINYIIATKGIYPQRA